MNLYKRLIFLIILQFFCCKIVFSQYQFDSKFGIYGTRDSNFIAPVDISIDGNGFIYVSDAFNNKIVKFDKNGKFVLSYGYQGFWDGVFDAPLGICNDSLNNLFVADQANGKIQEFNSSGVFQNSSYGIGADSFKITTDIAIGKGGNLFITSGSWGSLKVYNYGLNKHIRNIGSAGSLDGQFLYPYGIAIGTSGLLYITDSGKNIIHVFDSLGNYKKKIGQPGSGIGQLSSPSGISMDKKENLFIADYYNSRIQIFDSTGNCLGSVGSEGANDGQLDRPQGIFVDKRNYLYVTEFSNHRVSIFKPVPKVNVKHGLISITPTTGIFNFTNTLVTASQTISFVIENIGFDTLDISNILKLSGSANFVINTTSTNLQIYPFKNTTFDITFTPTSVGLVNAIIEIDSDDPINGSYKFKIQGSGVEPVITLSLYSTTINSSSPVDFGNVANGYTIQNTFSITNTGTSTLNISSIIFLSGDPDFSVNITNTNLAIGISSSTSLNVLFHPSSLGTKSAIFSISSNDLNTPTYFLSVTGESVDEPEFNIKEGGLDIPYVSLFGYQNIGSSEIKTYTIENLASATLYIYSFDISQTGSNYVLDTSTTLHTIPSFSSTDFTVTYTPSSSGLKEALISIKNDDTDEGNYMMDLIGSTITTTSISNNDNVVLNINLFPNPASQNINVHSAYNIEQIRVIDMLGIEVMNISSSGNTQVDISRLPKGLYNFVITTNKGIGNKKVSIQ